jgi:hypothetical protein
VSGHLNDLIIAPIVTRRVTMGKGDYVAQQLYLQNLSHTVYPQFVFIEIADVCLTHQLRQRVWDIQQVLGEYPANNQNLTAVNSSPSLRRQPTTSRF